MRSNKPLVIGDAVRLYVDDLRFNNAKDARQAIGWIRFIGYIPLKSGKLTHWIGIELLEKSDRGHDGSINDTKYFNVENGYGIHVPIINIIEVLSMQTVMAELKHTLSVVHRQRNHIHHLQSVITKQKTCIPLVPIDVNLPASGRSSKCNSFALPAPITPVTPTQSISRSCTQPLLYPKNGLQRIPSAQPVTGSSTPSVSTLSDSVVLYSDIDSSFHTYRGRTPSISRSSFSRTPFTPAEQMIPWANSSKQTRNSMKNNDKPKRFGLLFKPPVPEVRNDVKLFQNKKKKK
eukprot:130695_1